MKQDNVTPTSLGIPGHQRSQVTTGTRYRIQIEGTTMPDVWSGKIPVGDCPLPRGVDREVLQ